MTASLAGIILSLWGIMFGYIINRLVKVEEKQGQIDCNNTSIQTQLASIATDLAWIKIELQKGYDERRG